MPKNLLNSKTVTQPTLFLMVGLPGSGKTTRAKEIELEHSALRLTPDEWILDLYGNSLNRTERDSVRDPIEKLQWKIAERALGLGCNVILDWGFWSKAERMNYRKQAESTGASVQVVFLDANINELWSRISQREVSQKGTLHITKSDFEKWFKSFEPPSREELAII